MPAMALVLALLALVPIRQVEFVIVREGAKEYHRPGCPVVRDGKSVIAMSRGEAEAKKLKPHAECDPLNPRNKTADLGRPAPPVYVFTDGSTHYHREKCEKLKPDGKRVTLEAAAKKHWPCRVCKPPIRSRTPRT